MPGQPSSPCHRPMARQTMARLSSPAQAGVWITDAMLRRSLEHFHRLSSHCGPLESRRRLGKRHMAGLMPPLAPTYPALWHFDLAVPREWQWEPPTTPEFRRRARRSLSISSLFNRLLSWLEGDVDKPFIQPPPDGLDVVPEDTPAAKTHDWPIDFPQEIVRLREKIALLDTVDESSLFRPCRACRRSLTRRIRRGHLSVSGLRFALDPLDDATLSRLPPDPKLTGKITAMIRRTILAALEDAQRDLSGDSLAPLWLEFARWVCASKGGHANTQLLWRLMHACPESTRARIPPDQITCLARSLVAEQASRHNVFAHWVARAHNFAQICERLSAAQRSQLALDMHTFLTPEEGETDVVKRRRFSWLMVEACDGGVSNEAFVDSHRRLITALGMRLNSLQLWQLMLGRAGPSLTVESGTPSQRWAALVRTLPGDRLREMCACLRDMGELDSLADALLSAPAHRVRVDAVGALAAACDDHRLALRLYEALLTDEAVDRRLLGKHFPWEFWRPYVRRFIRDPGLASLQLGRLLRLAQRTSNTDVGAVAARIELLDRMGGWYMEVTHLSSRQLFRRIGECAAIQRVLINSVSPEILATLACVIVRDLEMGKMGRTTRLMWLVSLVERVEGEAKAESVASIVRGWRYMIQQGDAKYL